MKFDVITFGSAVTDTFIETEKKESGNKFEYKIGEKILINDLKFDIGGGGTNTAVAFARLGLKTGVICKVGRDENAKNIKNLLKKEKIKILCKDGKDKTGYSIILDSHGKGRTILTYKGESNNIKFKDLKNFKTEWLYYSSLLGTSLKTQKDLIKKLKRGRTKLAFNPSDYLIRNENIKDLLRLTEILILNKEEAEMLKKKYKRKEKLLQAISKLGPKIVVITNKNKKILAFDGKEEYTLTPNKVKAVERTGAGDAFASGFTAAIIAGLGIQDALRLGLRESESVIKYFGAKNKLIKGKLK